MSLITSIYGINNRLKSKIRTRVTDMPVIVDKDECISMYLYLCISMSLSSVLLIFFVCPTTTPEVGYRKFSILRHGALGRK